MRSGITKRFCRQTSQEVCPWNVKFAQELAEGSAFAARAMFVDAGSRNGTRALSREILMMEPTEYAVAFKGSAINRAKSWMLERNACVVLGMRWCVSTRRGRWGSSGADRVELSHSEHRQRSRTRYTKTWRKIWRCFAGAGGAD